MRTLPQTNVVDIAAMQGSGGSSTGVGGHEGEEQGDDRFEIADGHGVEEVVAALTARGLQPVVNEYIYV